MGLYHKYRPRTLDEVVGQPEAVAVMRGWLAAGTVPNAVLFYGPSGCGKTTLARILSAEIGCPPDDRNMDFRELNAAKERGIEVVRGISAKLWLAPRTSKYCVYIFDEAHQLVKKKGGDAQTALLKMCEDTPPHVRFMLCTTDPLDMLLTLRNRCSQVKVAALKDKEVFDLVTSVADRETNGTGGVGEEVRDKIVEAAEGSARQALVLLESVLPLKTDEERLAVIEKPTALKAAKDIAFALLYQPRATWASLAPVVRAARDAGEEAEAVRLVVLAFAANEMLKPNGKCDRAMRMATAFETSLQWSGRPGWAFLCRACIEMCASK